MKTEKKAPPRMKRFNGATLELAPRLLGKTLCTEISGELTSGVIVEVEAYHEESDQASHSYRGRTARNDVMFWPCGHCYVYMIYGVHFCVNVVSEPADTGAAILIRSLEPVEGIECMSERRKKTALHHLTTGPGKLCEALGITRALDGENLRDSHKIWIENSVPPSKIEVETSPRIGISKSKELHWRFSIKGSRWLSRKF